MVRRFFILFFIGLILPLTAIHAISNITFSPAVSIPSDGKFMVGQNYTFTDNSDRGIADYTISLFKYLLIVVVTLAILSVIIGGVIYLTAAGNAKSEAEAKSYIMAGLSGAALTVCAYLLLATINTDLVNLKLDSIKDSSIVTAPVTMPACYWWTKTIANTAGSCRDGFAVADNSRCSDTKNNQIVDLYKGAASNNLSDALCCCSNDTALSASNYCAKLGGSTPSTQDQAQGNTCKTSSGQWGYCENITGQGLICRPCKKKHSQDWNITSEDEKCYRNIEDWECPDAHGICGNISKGDCNAEIEIADWTNFIDAIPGTKWALIQAKNYAKNSIVDCWGNGTGISGLLAPSGKCRCE